MSACRAAALGMKLRDDGPELHESQRRMHGHRLPGTSETDDDGSQGCTVEQRQRIIVTRERCLHRAILRAQQHQNSDTYFVACGTHPPDEEMAPPREHCFSWRQGDASRHHVWWPSRSALARDRLAGMMGGGPIGIEHSRCGCSPPRRPLD